MPRWKLNMYRMPTAVVENPVTISRKKWSQ
jgi:hypothetical protein